MADAKYDAIVIGGGNKGLATAMYLTKYGGMKTAIFEIRHEAGGGWSSEETAAPGFVVNTHSTSHSTWYYELIWEDFPDFKEKGGELLFYKGGTGMVFKEDDTCLVMYTSAHDPTWEKTAQNVARFSQKDADTVLKYAKVWDDFIYPEFRRWVWTTPIAGRPDPFMQSLLTEGPKHGLDPLWLYKSLMQVLDELFESAEIKCSLIRACYSWWGGPADYPATGLHGFIYSLGGSREFGFVKGGSHSSAHAAQKIVVENGGKIFTRKEVDKVVIENGKAKGVRLMDGSEVEAKVVVSTLSPQLLCSKLIGEEYLPQGIIAKMRALCTYIAPDVWWSGWALHEAPNYKASSFNPDINQTFWIGLGDKDPWSSSKEFWRRMLGREYPGAPIIEAVPAVWCHSIVDPTVAPSGKHSAGTEVYTCATDQFSEKEWVQYERAHAEYMLNKWSQYAPNMTRDNVIGYDIASPWDITYRLPQTPIHGTWNILDGVISQIGWNRPIPELSDHRTPIKGLYGTGSGWHPMGGAIASGGYTCYKVISEDYGLRKPWEEAGREY